MAPAREIWRDAMPKVNFAEAYNEDRYQAAKDDPVLPETTTFLYRLQQRNSTFMPSRNMYQVVRSDLDEEVAAGDHFHLPVMPRTWGGTASRAGHHDDWRLGPDEEPEACCSLKWIDSACFGGLSGLVIVFNAAVIGLETDIKSELWWWLDQFMLGFFTMELVLKICRYGCEYFRNEDEWIWNWFDFTIVFCGAFDQWFMPAFQAFQALEALEGDGGPRKRSKLTVIFMLLRMARLLRIVRLFRLIKIVRPLYELAQGVLEALQGMFWVLVFMMMTLYAMAMLCQLFVGDGEIFSPDIPDEDTKAFREMFRTVSSSLFALFGTMSSWSLTRLVPLFERVPAFRLFFVIFYVYSAWGLLAVMTGVVSENMLAIREQMLKEDNKKEQMRKEHIFQFLSNLFHQADSDNSGQVSRDEFDMMLRSPELVKKLMKYSKTDPNDLQELFSWIDHDNSGTINLEEFMDGFKWINESLRAKSLVKVFQRVGNDTRALRKHVVDTIEGKFHEINVLLRDPLRKVHVICEQMQTLDSTFGEFAAEVSQPMDMPTQQELLAAEGRLSEKLEKVSRRLAQVEAKWKF